MPRVIAAVHVFELPMIFIFYEKAIQKCNNTLYGFINVTGYRSTVNRNVFS
ncbi:hypothetical protein J2W55_001366 [Mucilaginibacter pocheonensis]|uniref:Uncharacterized protein n=1 Tax=Mucilaginibacter pocheonensis TaxID=398050 RepID=A0ABU1T804_9SPHI|nr:hypothetical protein [Mucilaginibacter pocheonensis]